MLLRVLDGGAPDGCTLILETRFGAVSVSVQYGDSALDYIFARGTSGRDVFIVPNDGLSDHLALFTVFDDWNAGWDAERKRE